MMREQLKDILSFDKSIINNYVDTFNNYWEFLANLGELIISIGKSLDKNEYTEVQPNVWVNKSSQIDQSAKIIGPCIIDKDAQIRINAFIRGNVIIGKGCVVGNSSEIKNAVLFDKAKIPHFNYIGDSILGYHSHFGAGALTSNVKSNGETIIVTLNGCKYNTGRKKFGSVVGDGVEIGCNVVLNPGVIIGRNTNIYPLTMIRGEIESNRIVKSMNNIVVKRENNNSLKRIYIDFDGTLFNTDKYLDDLINIFNEFGISNDVFNYEKSLLFNKDKLFNIKDITNHLINKYNISMDIINKIDGLLNNSYIYPDVYSCLDILINNGYELYLLTYGDKVFQNMKIDGSNISKYFKEIIITDMDKSKLDIDYNNSIFIDNNPDEVEKLYNIKTKKVIRLRRDSDRYSMINLDNLDVIECSDFYQVIKILCL